MAYEMDAMATHVADFDTDVREYVVVEASGSDPTAYGNFLDYTNIHWVDHASTRDHSVLTWATGLGGLFAFIRSAPSVTAFRIDADLCRKYSYAIGVYRQSLEAIKDRRSDKLPALDHTGAPYSQGAASDSFMDRLIAETSDQRREMEGGDEDDEETHLMREYGKSLVTDSLATFLCRLTSVTFGDASLLKSMIGLAQMGRIAPKYVRIPATFADLAITSDHARTFEFHEYLPNVVTMRLRAQAALGVHFVRAFSNVNRLILDFRVPQTSDFGLPPGVQTLVLSGAHYAFNARLPLDVSALSCVTRLGLADAGAYYGTGDVTAVECKARSSEWAFLAPGVMCALEKVTIDIDADLSGSRSNRLFDLLLRVSSMPKVNTLYLSHSLGRPRDVESGGGGGLDWASIGCAIAAHGPKLLLSYKNVVIDVSTRFSIGRADPGEAWPLALSKLFPFAENVFALRTPRDKIKDNPDEREQILSLDGVTDADIRLDALAIKSLATMLSAEHGHAPRVFECTGLKYPPHSGDVLRQFEVTEDPVQYAESGEVVMQPRGGGQDDMNMEEMGYALDDLGAGFVPSSARELRVNVAQLD